MIAHALGGRSVVEGPATPGGHVSPLPSLPLPSTDKCVMKYHCDRKRKHSGPCNSKLKGLQLEADKMDLCTV